MCVEYRTNKKKKKKEEMMKKVNQENEMRDFILNFFCVQKPLLP